MVRKKYTMVDKEAKLVASANTTDVVDDEIKKMRLTYTAEEILTDETEDAHMTRIEERARRAIYKEVKQKVKIMEQNNSARLIVFRDYRMPWFKAGGNSAIFYAFDLAGRMGKKNVNVNADKDGYATFHDGVVSFHGTKNLIENMRKAGYNDPKVINDGWILVFDLEKDYSKADIKAMKKVGKERERKFNELVLPENEYPKVYYDILTVIKRIPPNIFKLNPNQRQAFSQATMLKLVDLHNAYLNLANGKVKVLDGAEEMLEIVTWLQSLTKILLEGRFWEMSVCAPIGQALAELVDDINKCVIKPEKDRQREYRKRKMEKEKLKTAGSDS